MDLNRLRNADLNLLVLFQALMLEKNISRAAEKMNLTQPAMSRALHRLKEQFQDELLVRTANGYTPTAKALTMQSELERLFPKIDELLRSERFDPSRQKGNFRIAATDFGAAVILPPVFKRLAEEAPQIELTVKHWHNNTFNRLDSGSLELALSAGNCPPQLKSEILFRDELVCILNRNHPLAKGTMSLKKYLSFPHVAISIRGGKQEPVDQFLEERRLERRIVVRTPYSTSAAYFTQQTDAILTFPKRYIDHLTPASKVVAVPAPKEFPLLNYSQIWHPRADQDPYSQWMRSVIKNSFAEN